MRRIFFFLIVFSLLCISNASQAVQFPNTPTAGNFYVDDAHLISNDTRAQINILATDLWQAKAVPLFVVTIPSLAAEDAANLTIEKYATLLFNYWGIGQKENSTGILLLISRDDRKGRIELGRAYAHKYDGEAQRIMDNLIVPPFKKGDYSTGILQGVQALSDIALNKQYRQLHQFSHLQQFFAIGFVLLLLGIIISLFTTGKTGWGWGLILFLVGIVIGTIALTKNSGKSGSNNDDDRFGGGSSGGGGGTGSW